MVWVLWVYAQDRWQATEVFMFEEAGLVAYEEWTKGKRAAGRGVQLARYAFAEMLREQWPATE